MIAIGVLIGQIIGFPLVLYLATKKLPGVVEKTFNTMEKPKTSEQRKIGYLQGMILYSGKMKDFKGVC